MAHFDIHYPQPCVPFPCPLKVWKAITNLCSWLILTNYKWIMSHSYKHEIFKSLVSVQALEQDIVGWADMSTQQIGMCSYDYIYKCICMILPVVARASVSDFLKRSLKMHHLWFLLVLENDLVCELKCISFLVGWSHTPLTNLEWWPQMMWETVPSAKKLSQLPLCRMVILDSVLCKVNYNFLECFLDLSICERIWVDSIFFKYLEEKM